MNGHTITTMLCDQRHNEYTHYLLFHAESNVFETYITYANRSQEERELEASFGVFADAGSRSLKNTKKTDRRL